MIEIKKKNDILFLIITAVIASIAIIFKVYYVPISFLIGWLGGSIALTKDVKKLENNNYNQRIIINIISNMVIYAIALVLAGLLFNALGILVASAGLLVYRTLFFNKVKAKGDDDDRI